jgi:ABC-2 type transport system permease protein
MLRYLRLLVAFGRFTLANELAFRANFIMKILVEVLWLVILLIFYQTLFSYTKHVASWSAAEYLFFVGAYYTLEGVIETFFLENCTEFADLVRSGDLDAYLLRPCDEQFLITCRKIDWSTAPKLLLGAGIMLFAASGFSESVGFGQVIAFLILFACGVALAYSFLVILTSTAVWMTRNTSLMELWWLFTTVMRYPRQIYEGNWASWLGVLFWYLLPVLLVLNVPASVIVTKFFDPWSIALLILATVVMLYLSRRFFYRALAAYRSASS